MTKPAAATPAKKAVVAPSLTAISAALPLPERGARGGGKSVYPFDELQAPVRDDAGNITGAYSFGVKNKTARELSSIVSNANKSKKYAEKAKNEDGSFKYKTKRIETAPGQFAEVPTQEHEMVQTRKFAVYAVDPKTDPDGAQARVYREL